MPVRYCTFFNSGYLTRGLVMLDSLAPYMRDGDEAVILALDDITRDALRSCARPGWRIVTLADMADEELLALERTRPRREFFWTCGSALSAWLVNESADGDIVAYVDADLMFFADPHCLFDELADGGNILIHEHRFAPAHAHLLKNGRFNVGLVAFRVNDESRACVNRWRAQTIERCEADAANGVYADQAYLNEWPARYRGVRVMRNLGGGVAPWNVNQYAVGEQDGAPTVDGYGLVFYHYHALETINEPSYGLAAVRPSLGYAIPRRTQALVYRPYARKLKQYDERMARQGVVVDSDGVSNWLTILIKILSGQYVRAF